MDELDKIIHKILDLMKLAQDNPNDEEGQTALLLAQKLLLKYNLSLEDIHSNTSQDDPEISEMGAKSLKRMAWWKLKLHAILARNFRCKSIRRRRHQKTTLIFFGYEADVKTQTNVGDGTFVDDDVEVLFGECQKVAYWLNKEVLQDLRTKILHTKFRK